MPQLALDPMTSEAQRRAMWAAAEGESKIGIPSGVGREFAEADPGGKLPERAKDMGGGDWRGLIRGLLKFFMEEEREPEHQEDPGAEVDYDEAPNRGAGVAFVTPTGHALFVKRSDAGDHGGEWCFPGGAPEGDETPEECARREAAEEIGDCTLDGLEPLDARRTGDVGFHTFRQGVDARFKPTLNDESTQAVWAPLTKPPLPLHPGVKATLDKMLEDEFNEADHPRDPTGKFGSGGKSPNFHDYANKHFGGNWSLARNPKEGETKVTPKQFSALKDRYKKEHPEAHLAYFGSLSDDEAIKKVAGKLSETTREKIGEPGSEKREDMPESVFLGPDRTYPVKEKRDGEWQYTRNLLIAAARRARLEHKPEIAKRADEIREREFGGNGRAQDLALDASKRTMVDGRLHVADNIISQAVVNGYRGDEIPGWEELGLDPGRVYQLLRDPDELRKAAPTFNQVPILSKHMAVSAEEFPAELVIGATGTDAAFDGTSLKNSLVFWTKDSIDRINDGEARELSAAYKYVPVMEPGVYHGVPYDGRMTKIEGNHVAAVYRGRVGKAASVGDAALDQSTEWALVERALLEAWGVRK